MNVRQQPGFFKIRRGQDGRNERISPAVRGVLLAMLEYGQFSCRGADWVCANGARAGMNTIEAAFDRRLVKVSTDSRHRTRFAASLTEIGERVARDLLREADERRAIDERISEDASIIAGAI